MSESSAGVPVRRQGRPRDPDVDEAIITAVFDVIAEAGFAGFSVEAVAARAGVGKATIYRRWPTREELIMAAAERVMVRGELPDTGSLRDDLVEWYWQRHRAKDPEGDGRLMGQVIVEAVVNPDLKQLLGRFLADRRDAVSQMCRRAQARGDTLHTEPDVILDLVSGALIHRALFSDARVERVDIERFVDVALGGRPT